MSFFKKFGITFGNKKNKLLPESKINFKENIIEPTIFAQTDNSAFKTLATFDINVEPPKYEGAIPEATIKFYPLK
ncbi:MAG: hypothetical protein IJ220_04140 [Clostridia bacterium]|nr:hypothetical protein [Clostridia bacterium]